MFGKLILSTKQVKYQKNQKDFKKYLTNQKRYAKLKTVKHSKQVKYQKKLIKKFSKTLDKLKSIC